MKKAFVIVLTALLCMSFIFAGGASEAQSTSGGELPAMEAKLATIYSATHPMGQTAIKFADLVSQYTNGKFTVKIYNSEQLGSMAEAFESLALGMIEFDMAPFSEAAKRWAVCGIIEAPYVFRDTEHCMKFLASDSFKMIRDGLTANAGVTPLGSFYAGTRQTTTTKAVFTTPDECKALGLKLRASGVYTSAAVKLMGAAATPMALSEVYVALQNGTVDGQENPTTTILSNAFYEVQKNLIMTGHIIQPQAIFVNAAYFAKLPKEYQDAITKAAQEAAIYANGLFVEKEAADLATLKEKGMNVVEVNKASFIAAAQDYHKEKMADWGQDLYDAIQNIK